ncbi:hypothetical protein BCR43DRAFT_507512 [Syncephalastrum racemosum]|uniref:HMG box domain-containing protein n=1 Tax=Syncephalastrum racemosum TaxID=13706 RepID=A0A1X2H3U6_SYNRA|nr:hypothetical protein BCR43DRAFT_507512 [Syncephalastrum racemosum]
MEEELPVALHLIGDAIMQIGIGMNNIANAMTRSKPARRRIGKAKDLKAKKKTHRLTPYNLYVKDMMLKLRDKHPAESPTDAFKRIANSWRATTEDVKANYKVICELQQPKVEPKQEEHPRGSKEANKQHAPEKDPAESSSSLTSTKGGGAFSSRDTHAGLEQRRAGTEQSHDSHPLPWLQEGNPNVNHTIQKLPRSGSQKTTKRRKQHNTKKSKYKGRWNTNASQ